MPRPPLILLTAAVFAVGCGSDTKTVAAGETPAATIAPTPKVTNDRVALEGLAVRFVKAYNGGDIAAVCAMMTEGMRREMIASIRQIAEAVDSCGAAILTTRTFRSRIPAMKLTRIRVNGARATAVDTHAADAGDRNRRFVRVGGRWLLDA